MLEEINNDLSQIEKYKSNAALRFIFQYAFMPEKKFDLPEGDPPFKADAAPIGMSPANFIMETKKLYVFTKERPLNKVRKEQLFIQLLESIHPSEAKVLLAIKDQKLNKLYKKITLKFVVDAGFVPQPLKIEEKMPKKSHQLFQN